MCFLISYQAGRSQGQGLSYLLLYSHCAHLVSCTQQALNKYLFNDGAKIQMKTVHAVSSVIPCGRCSSGKENGVKVKHVESNSETSTNWSYLGVLVCSKMRFSKAHTWLPGVHSYTNKANTQVLTSVHHRTYSEIRACFPQSSLATDTQTLWQKALFWSNPDQVKVQKS